MKALILEKPGQFGTIELPEAARPIEDQVLVRIRSVGVCGTDLHAFRGRQPFFTYPRILGHELGVEVLEVASEQYDLGPGDLCAVNPYLSCGECAACRRGKTNCCSELKVLGVHVDGGMRERMLMPARALYRSDTLSPPELALVETLGIGGHAVNRSGVEAGQQVLVIGAGPIGLSTITLLNVRGLFPAVLEMSASRRAFCEKHMQISASYADASEVQQSGLPEVVFDCTGNPQSMEAAFSFPAHGGKLVFVGLFSGDVRFHDPDFHRKELTLLASRNSTPAEHHEILSLLENHKIDTKAWISEEVPAAEMIGSFPRWLDPSSGVLKAVVTW